MPGEKPKVLVVDDEQNVLDFLERSLSAMGFVVATAGSGAEGLACCAEEVFDLVLADLKMPGMDGIEMMRRLREQDAGVDVVVMTGYASVESAVEAMKAGARDYLTKPLDMDHMEIVLNRLLENRRQALRLRLLEEQVRERGSFEGLIGVSPAMQRVYRTVERVADSDVTVLLQGETGTGKELVARAIHRRSGRPGAFMPINCGALPETLLESELFGHERGAFTGAVRQKYGLIEQAGNGTLFLDELEEMSPALQVKLLRAVQEREVLRVGGDRPIPVDFRLVAASNVDLQERMAQGMFRADLFYRLSGVVLELPPLRARPGDIPLLAAHFVRAAAERRGQPSPEIAPEAMMMLAAYAWLGNVRELQNAVEQAVLLSGGAEAIGPEHLPEQLVRQAQAGGPEGVQRLPLREARAWFERCYLERLLAQTGGNVAEAARLAGINRQHFYAKMKRYGISRTKNEEE